MTKRDKQFNEMRDLLWWVSRSARFLGPLGTRPCFISDKVMNRAKAIVAEVCGDCKGPRSPLEQEAYRKGKR